MKIGWECPVLAGLCGADMISTAWLVSTGRAVEANPVMNFYIAHGVFPFLLAKSMMFIAPLVLLELFRQRKPRFVGIGMRIGIVVYLLTYGVGIWRLNLSSTARTGAAPPAIQTAS